MSNNQDCLYVHSTYGKNPQEFSAKQKSYELETWHAASGHKLNKAYINYDLGLTLTYFMARSNLLIMLIHVPDPDVR